jgi:hypothetical protein
LSKNLETLSPVSASSSGELFINEKKIFKVQSSTVGENGLKMLRAVNLRAI